MINSRRTFSSVSRVLLTSSKSSSKSPGTTGGSSAKKNSSKNESTPKQTEPVEKFTNDSYNAPEYFAHNKFSFADVMVNLVKQRLPQKSNKVSS